MTLGVSNEEILEALEIPGLNIEASLEPRELELFLDGIRALVRKREARIWELAGRQIKYYERLCGLAK